MKAELKGSVMFEATASFQWGLDAKVQMFFFSLKNTALTSLG